MQSISLKGFMELIGHEAIALEPYYDGGGVLTWGVGHTAAAGTPDPASLWGRVAPFAEVLATFRADLAHYEADVRAAITRPLSQAEFDAAVSFHFNTGAIGYATWVRKFNAGDRAGAIAAMLSWSTPPSIKPRRLKEQKLFAKGIYSNGEKGVVYETDGHGHVIWSSGKTIALRPLLEPQKLPPAPQFVIPPKPPVAAPAKAIQPGSTAVPLNSTHVVPSRFSAPPTGFLARLAHLFSL